MYFSLTVLETSPTFLSPLIYSITKKKISCVCACVVQVAVFCVRDDDSNCRKALSVAEMVNGYLAARGPSPLGNNVDEILDSPLRSISQDYDITRSDTRLVKVDMSESRTIADKYRVKTVPFVLFFYGGRTVYGGTLGGAALKVGGGIKQHKILLIEPNFSDQMKIEGVLTRQRHLG